MFLVLIIILFTPFYFLIIYNNSKELIHKTEFKKIKVRIDSLSIESGMSTTEGPSSLNIYEVYFNKKEEVIEFSDPSTILFTSKQEKKEFNDFMSRNIGVGDSIWVWHHPKLKDRYAMQNELELDVSNNPFHIFISLILLIISIIALFWQIRRWI